MNPASFIKLISIQIILIVSISILVLAGWQFDIEIFKHPAKGIVAMNPLTAITFILCSISLCLFLYQEKHQNFLTISRVIAFLIIAVGLMKILSITIGLNTGLDTFLYQQKLKADIVSGLPNTMAPNTSFDFVMIGASLFLITFNNKRRTDLSHALSLITLFISILSIIGYIYKVNRFYGVASFIPMALHTAICFLLLSFSILFVRGRQGFMGHITSKYQGSKIARLLIPTAIIVPVILGVLRLEGEKKGLYTTEYGTALFTVANIIIFILLIWGSVTTINRSGRIAIEEIEQKKVSEEKIKAANIFLDNILENIPDMVFVKEANEFRYIRINKQTEKILGITRDELIGKTSYDFFPKEQADAFLQKDRKVLASGKPIEVEEEKITTYNGNRWLRTTTIPVYDKNNLPLYLIGISEDITQKKKNEDKLKEFYKDLETKVEERTEELFRSEKRFRSLIENAEDVISLLDSYAQTIYVSPAIEKVTGFTVDEHLNSSEEIIFPDDREMARQIFKKALQHPFVPTPYTFRLVNKNGDPVWIEGTLTNLLNDENVKAVVSNYHDITERKKSEDELKKLSLVAKETINGVIIRDKDQNILWVNNAFTKMYGYELGEAIGKDPLQILAGPETDKEIVSYVKKQLRRKKPCSFETVFYAKDGKKLCVSSQIQPILDKNGDLEQSIALHTDITQERQLEEKVKLERITKQKEITDAVYAAQENERSEIGRELHDNVNQLLGATRLYIDMAKKQEENRESLLTDASSFTLTAIEEIRKLSKTLITPSIKDVGLTASIKDLAEEIMLVHPIKIIFTVNDFAEEELSDKFKLNIFRVVQEQINNILKHAQADEIEINIAGNYGKLLVSIRDNGIGFDTTKRKPGIGITNIKSRIELYNGTALLNSEQGKGTSLSVTFNKKELLLNNSD